MRLLRLVLCIAISAWAAAYGAEEAVRLKLRDGRTLEGIWDKWTGDFRMLGAPIKMTIKEADVLQTETLDLELYEGKWLDPKKVKELKFIAAQIKKGLVEVDGQWITKEENDARIAKAKEDKAKQEKAKADAKAAAAAAAEAKAAAESLRDWERDEITRKKTVLAVMMNRDLETVGKTHSQVMRNFEKIFYRTEPQSVLERMMIINDTLNERYPPLQTGMSTSIIMPTDARTSNGAVTMEVAELVKSKVDAAIAELAKPGVPLDKLWSYKQQTLGIHMMDFWYNQDEFQTVAISAVSYLPVPCRVTWDVSITLPDGRVGNMQCWESKGNGSIEKYYTMRDVNDSEYKTALRIEMAKLGQYPMVHRIAIAFCGNSDATRAQWKEMDTATRNQLIREYKNEKSVYTVTPTRIDWEFTPRLAKETKIAHVVWTKAAGTTIEGYVEKP